MKRHLGAACLAWILFIPAMTQADTANGQPLTYEKDVAPILRKYCAGCHNDDDREGEFSLETYRSMLNGTENGPAFLAKDPASSRIIRLMTGEADPQMPPEDEPTPSAEEIETVRLWIEQGAAGPKGAKRDRLALMVPKIESKTDRRPITAVAWSPSGDFMAIARYGEVTVSHEVQVKDAATGKTKREWQPVTTLKGFPSSPIIGLYEA